MVHSCSAEVVEVVSVRERRRTVIFHLCLCSGESYQKIPHPMCALCLSLCFMGQYPTEEDMIEWAKRESEREEKERLARLTQQEQEDLELAIALSKSELS